MTVRLSVFIPAYNAAQTVGGVLARIPQATWDMIQTLIVVNDGSEDDTALVVTALREKYPKLQLTSFDENRGYGSAVKAGLELCQNSDSDFVACLHADGQYPPEKLSEFVYYMQQHKVDILQGSRHKNPGALQGGMPLYKYAAGKCLTWIENLVFGLQLTDYHSGYLFYSNKALNGIPYDRLSDSFDFDVEVIATARRLGLRIDELGIATHYGEESSYLNPITYGFRVLFVLVKYICGHYDSRR